MTLGVDQEKQNMIEERFELLTTDVPFPQRATGDN